MTPVLAALVLFAPSQATLPSLIPQPQKAVVKPGTTPIFPDDTVLCGRDELSIAQRFVADLNGEQGRQWSAAIMTGARRVHAFRIDPKQSHLGAEGYILKTDGRQIRLIAAAPAGLYRGTRTLLQILRGANRQLGNVYIEDAPRFEWRGMHLDVSRHFFPAEQIKRYIDYLAEHKFNVFHWHLLDDGGWRMESKRFPKLTEIGAWRTEVPGVVWNQATLEFPGPDSGKKLYGGFYSQKDIREIVSYAAERFITVVPEIELPGHNLPALIAYPEVGCSIEPIPGYPYKTNVFCPGKEATFQFLANVLDETLELFPSKVIHIGGDEVDKSFWARCPDCKARMQAEGLRDTHELQSYFIRRIERHLNMRGRTLIGWDEILEGGLAPNAMVMSWRGTSGGVAAAKAGHDVVMSPTSHCYFDYPYATTPTSHVYSYEPVPAELSGEEARHVRGAQANVWTEWMPDFDRVETMIFPRMLAMSEVLWTRPEHKSWPDFERRLQPWYARWLDQAVDFHLVPPTAEADLIFRTGPALVAFQHSGMPGVELKVAIGSIPNRWSRTYREPIRIDHPARVFAQYFRGARALGEPTEVKVVDAIARRPAVKTEPGFQFLLHRRKFASLAEMESLPGPGVVRRRLALADLAGVDDPFGFVAEGWLRVETPGTFQFLLGSDDGSRLRVNGHTLIDNDGLHAYAEKRATAVLPAGWYWVELAYFEAGGAERLEATISGPGFGDNRSLLELLQHG